MIHFSKTQSDKTYIAETKFEKAHRIFSQRTNDPTGDEFHWRKTKREKKDKLSKAIATSSYWSALKSS